TAFVPVNQPFEVGVKFALKPMVSADRRSVTLDMKANLANLVPEKVPLFPITTFVTPIFEGGAQGQPIPFTQFIQMPKFERHTLDTKAVISDGSTAVFGGWKTTREERVEFRNACVAAAPVLGRAVGFVEQLTGCKNLLGSVGYQRASEYVVMLVTPRIIAND